MKEIEVKIKADKPKGMLEKIGISDPIELSSKIQRDFNASEQIKYLWIPERNKDVKDYFGVIQPSEWPFKGASQIKSNFQRIVVDTLSGNLLKSMFMPEHPLKADPSPLGNKSTSDVLSNIKYVEDVHNHLQANEYNLHSVLDKAIPTALVESYVVLHPTYEYRCNEYEVNVTRWIPKEVNTDGLTYDPDTDSISDNSGQNIPSIDMSQGYDKSDYTGMKEVVFNVTKEECTKDGISLNIINGYRFYMPLGSPGETPNDKIQRAPYVIHQMFYTIREVLDYSESGYFENVEIVLEDLRQRYDKNNPKDARGSVGKNPKPVIAATTYDRQRELITHTKLIQAGFLLDVARLEYEYVEILKWCGKYKINGKWADCIVWMDKNTHTILRVEKNIFGIKPYFLMVPFPTDESPYGESLCKIIRPLVQELDLALRTIMNIGLMKAAPPKFYDPASGFNPSTIGQYGPNSYIPAREPARNVFVPPQPEDPSVLLEFVKVLVNFLERITGVSETVQGQVANRANTTATEVNNALVRSGVRFDTIYERIKDQLKPMFSYIHKLTLRYMPDTKEVKLMGAENKGRFVTIHKQQVQGAYEFELVGNSVTSQQSMLQNAITLYSTLGQHPYLTYKPESIYYTLRNIVEPLNPIAVDKILPKPEEIQQLERDRQKVETEQEQMALKDQSNRPNPQQQQMQAELQMKQQQMQMDSQHKQNEMGMKQQEHSQKMRHAEETHKQKLAQAKALMEQQILAAQQQAEIQKYEMMRRAKDAAKASEPQTK